MAELSSFVLVMKKQIVTGTVRKVFVQTLTILRMAVHKPVTRVNMRLGKNTTIEKKKLNFYQYFLLLLHALPDTIGYHIFG